MQERHLPGVVRKNGVPFQGAARAQAQLGRTFASMDHLGPLMAELHTDRLVLTPLAVEDADEMAQVLSAPSLYTHIGGSPPSAEELRARYERQVAGPTGGDEAWLNWIIREAGRAVGFVQATVRSDGDRWMARVAWLVGSESQGRGVARESAQALLEHLKAHGVAFVEATVADDNTASVAVARHMRMRRSDRQEAGEAVWILSFG